MAKRTSGEVPVAVRPQAADYRFDLDRALSAVVGLDAMVAEDAFTAETLGTLRTGHGVLIRDDGLILTVGYLVTEAERIRLTTGAGKSVDGHALGFDQATGFGFVQALDSLDIPSIPIGDSRTATAGSKVVVAGVGGRANAVAAEIVTREEFAGYWEYLLDAAIFTGPNHPHWSGAAVIGPQGDLLGVGSLQVERQTSSGRASMLNMAIPLELLPKDLDAFIAGLKSAPVRPWLGVYAHEVDGHVMIAGVAPGGPAHRAGLQIGDVLLSVGGVAVASLSDFYLALWSLGTAGVEVPLRLQREHDAFDLTVRSGDRRKMLKQAKLH
jgi:S1-C subfamily serine protease